MSTHRLSLYIFQGTEYNTSAGQTVKYYKKSPPMQEDFQFLLNSTTYL
jgi:hypothetical protein